MAASHGLHMCSSVEKESVLCLVVTEHKRVVRETLHVEPGLYLDLASIKE